MAYWELRKTPEKLITSALALVCSGRRSSCFAVRHRSYKQREQTYASMRRAALLRSALRRRPRTRRRPPPSAPLLRASSSHAAANAQRDAQLEEATAFVVRVGAVREGKTYSRDVAEGVVAALADPSSGVSLSALLPTLKQLAGAYEIGEDNGLDALAAAVEREVNERAGKQLVHCSIKAGSASFDVSAYEGTSLYDVVRRGEDDGARALQSYLECACSGVMACSTCHVYVAPEWFSRVGEPCEAELDMLDLAHEPRENSRLGCQLVFTPELDGLELEVPDGANNLMDHIPFEDRG